MENQSALDARLWAAIRALHADFGAGAPDVEFSEFVPTRGRWAGILDQSTAYLSDRLERLGAACASGLECAAGGACAHGRGDHSDSTEYLAGQFSDRVNALRCLSARQCGAKRGDFLWIPNHTGRVATGLQHGGGERAGHWQSEKSPGEHGDGRKSIPAGFGSAGAESSALAAESVRDRPALRQWLPANLDAGAGAGFRRPHGRCRVCWNIGVWTSQNVISKRVSRSGFGLCAVYKLRRKRSGDGWFRIRVCG